MTTSHPPVPPMPQARPPATAATPLARPPAVPLLPAVFEDFAAACGRPRDWRQLPVDVRGDVRVVWACVRAGQTDPWLAALAGWRHRATWHRRTYRSATLTPDDDDLDSWDWVRAAIRDTDHRIAGQFLALAAHLITVHDGHRTVEATRTLDDTDRHHDDRHHDDRHHDDRHHDDRHHVADRHVTASTPTRPRTHLLHLGNNQVTVASGAGPAGPDVRAVVLAVARQGEHQARRWEHPLPLPWWVVALWSGLSAGADQGCGCQACATSGQRERRDRDPDRGPGAGPYGCTCRSGQAASPRGVCEWCLEGMATCGQLDDPAGQDLDDDTGGGDDLCGLCDDDGFCGFCDDDVHGSDDDEDEDEGAGVVW